MKRLHKKIRRLGASMLLVLAASPVLAEVSVQVDSSGDLLSLNVTTSVSGPWTKTSSVPDSQVLNAGGDKNGDKAPVYAVTSKTVGESVTASNDMAYVVWPRYDGHDHEIAYSYFRNQCWSSVLSVTRNNEFVDLEPSMAEHKGRLYLAWWRDEAVPKVYYSKYDGNAWTAPEMVSDPKVTSKSPKVSINGKLEVVISFSTFDGNKNGTTELIREGCDP